MDGNLLLPYFTKVSVHGALGIKEGGKNWPSNMLPIDTLSCPLGPPIWLQWALCSRRACHPVANALGLPISAATQQACPEGIGRDIQGIGRDIPESHLHCVKRVHRRKEENLRTSVLAPTLEDAQGRICLAMLHRRVFISYRDFYS